MTKFLTTFWVLIVLATAIETTTLTVEICTQPPGGDGQLPPPPVR